MNTAHIAHVSATGVTASTVFGYHAGTTMHRRAPQSELTPLKPGGQAAGRASPAPKGMAAV